MIKAFREATEANELLGGGAHGGLFAESSHLIRTATSIAKANEARNAQRHLAQIKDARPPTPHLVPLPPAFVESVDRNGLLPPKDVQAIKTKFKRQLDLQRVRGGSSIVLAQPKELSPLQEVLQTAYMSWANMRIMNKEHTRRLRSLTSKSGVRVRTIKHGGLCEGEIFQPEDDGVYSMPPTLATRTVVGIEKRANSPTSKSVLTMSIIPNMREDGNNQSITAPSPKGTRNLSFLAGSGQGFPSSDSFAPSAVKRPESIVSGDLNLRSASRTRSIVFADALRLAGFGPAPPGTPGGVFNESMGSPAALTRRESVMMASGIFNLVKTIPKPPETIAAPLLFRRQHKVKGEPAKRSPMKKEDPTKPPIQQRGVPLTNHEKFRLEYADSKLDFDALGLKELSRSEDIRRRCFDDKATAFTEILNNRKFVNAPWNVVVKKVNAQVAQTLGKEFSADQDRQREHWLSQIYDCLMDKYSMYPECEFICDALRKLCSQEDFVFEEPQFLQLLASLPEHKLLLSHIVAIFDLLRPIFNISPERMNVLITNRLKVLEDRAQKLADAAHTLVDQAEWMPSTSLPIVGPTTFVVKIVDLRIFSDSEGLHSCHYVHISARCDDVEKVTSTKSNHNFHPIWNEELILDSSDAENVLFLTVIGGEEKSLGNHVLAMGYVNLESYVPYGELKNFIIHLNGICAMKLTLTIREEKKVSLVPRPPPVCLPDRASPHLPVSSYAPGGSFRRPPNTFTTHLIKNAPGPSIFFSSTEISLSRTLDPDTCPRVIDDDDSIALATETRKEHTTISP